MLIQPCVCGSVLWRVEGLWTGGERDPVSDLWVMVSEAESFPGMSRYDFIALLRVFKSNL